MAQWVEALLYGSNDLSSISRSQEIAINNSQELTSYLLALHVCLHTHNTKKSIKINTVLRGNTLYSCLYEALLREHHSKSRSFIPHSFPAFSLCVPSGKRQTQSRWVERIPRLQTAVCLWLEMLSSPWLQESFETPLYSWISRLARAFV